MPRGRWYLKLRPTSLTPFASKAEASVSPASPVMRSPSKLNESGRARSIALPPAAKRKRSVMLRSDPEDRVSKQAFQRPARRCR